MIQDGLKEFMPDETICFLGIENKDKVLKLMRGDEVTALMCRIAVEVGEKAAKVRKSWNLVH